MADQSAIRIPQGQLPINLVDDVMKIYCSPQGSDTDGDGSITDPYFHPTRALRDFRKFFFTENGHGIVECAEGTYNYESPVIVNNKDKKKITIKGASATESFRLQEVTSYKYDSIENKDQNGYGVGSLVDQRITVKLAATTELLPAPTSPITPSTTGVVVGDYLIFKDTTSARSTYYPTGKDGSIGGEGLTGPTPGDARTNILGCFEVIAVNNTDNTVTFRSRGKNFLHKIGESKITNGGSIALGSDIFVGGYDSENGCETGDPTGLYGSLQTSGIDTTSGPLVSNHIISVKVLKSIFKFKRSDSLGRNAFTKGLVLKANSSLAGLQDIAFQGDVRFKHFNEMDAAASNGECILAFKNSSIGSGHFRDVGISGWYAGIVAHTNSNITANGIGISDCSFGIVAENNSIVSARNSVITGSDIIGVLATNNSTINCPNTTVGSGGYSPLTVDLADIGSDIVNLTAGTVLTIDLGESRTVTTKCVWNSYMLPRNTMSDPIKDAYNYYPFCTGNQVYLRSMWPLGVGSGLRDISTNETAPNKIIKTNGLLFGVGSGVLPENSEAVTYTPDGLCNTTEEDLSGGVCYQPGFFGDPFDFVSTGDGTFFNDPSADCPCSCPQCRGEDGGCPDLTSGQLQISCKESCCACPDFPCESEANKILCNPDVTECGDDSIVDGGDTPVCPGGCDNWDVEGCEPASDGDGYCALCEFCRDPNTGELPGTCECDCCTGTQCECCSTDPPCWCNDGAEACCDVVCTLPVHCNESGCCCDAEIGPGGVPCYCVNEPTCGDSIPPDEICPDGTIISCTDCDVCKCGEDTHHPGRCPTDGPCFDEPEPPSNTTYNLVDHPLGIGFMSYNNSTIVAERSFVSLMRNAGYLAMENSSLDVGLSFARGCAGPGYLARENSSINARNSSAQRTRGGYTARQNSNIQAQFSHATDNAEYSFIAVQDSIINCENSTVAISRTMSSGNQTATITTANEIYAGLSKAYGKVNGGSYINKTGNIEIEDGTVTPNGAFEWEVDSSSNIEPNSSD